MLCPTLPPDPDHIQVQICEYTDPQDEKADRKCSGLAASKHNYPKYHQNEWNPEQPPGNWKLRFSLVLVVRNQFAPLFFSVALSPSDRDGQRTTGRSYACTSCPHLTTDMECIKPRGDSKAVSRSLNSKRSGADRTRCEDSSRRHLSRIRLFEVVGGPVWVDSHVTKDRQWPKTYDAGLSLPAQYSTALVADSPG